MASSKTPRGKIPAARTTGPKAERPGLDPAFTAQWNELPKRHRKGIRRLTRLCRPQLGRHDAELAVTFAGFQRTRGWYRFFWAWFVPLMLGGLMAATAIGPLAVGIVFGSGFFAVWARRGYRQVERINAKVLEGDTEHASAAAAA
jgi:hypothetical protein